MRRLDGYLQKNNTLTLYIIGYKNQGESIVINIADQFIGVLDSYKTPNHFVTKDILDGFGRKKVNFLCWTHTDADHTLGMSDLLKNHVDRKTLFFLPEGFQAKEIQAMYSKYVSSEYQEISKIADKNIAVSNYISVNQSVSETYSILFSSSSEKLYIDLEYYTPLSRVVKNLSQKAFDNYFKRNKYVSNKPNYFSTVLKITVRHPDIIPITICLTSDLDNYIIKRMDEEQAQECFDGNLIIKIPHHGSKHSRNILEYINSFGFAATTSYSSSNLPQKEILDSYKLINPNVSFTGKDNTQEYGIIKYEIKLTDKFHDLIKLTHLGGAGIY
ncbi:hypothetical protein [Neobacillus citreus]|uniref:Metallo-beta-lactamase domain-containing protein n=1 Tax=Neobacillus citreus TaxID=2833578 RepID=A0A942T4I5_9BACI|nr:hypothetical protein [Neobacillus citreus]MCH6265323.1 hypothetical protein [Neobacillus citreus]